MHGEHDSAKSKKKWSENQKGEISSIPEAGEPRSPITSVVSGTVSPLFLPVALRGQPSLTVGRGSHVHKCLCRWLGLRAPDESNRRHGVLCMWGRNGLGAASCRLWLDMVFAGIRRHPLSCYVCMWLGAVLAGIRRLPSPCHVAHRDVA